MNTTELIYQILSATGWKPRPVTKGGERALRMTYGNLEVDHRPRRGELWLWILEPDDKRCFALRYGDRLEEAAQAIAAIQDELSIESYLGAYLQLQKVCEISVVAWEQDEAPEREEDPVVFEGFAVPRLSDYVRILKRLQKNDLIGALTQYGLDLGSWGTVAAAWGGQLTRDPRLTVRFAEMMGRP